MKYNFSKLLQFNPPPPRSRTEISSGWCRFASLHGAMGGIYQDRREAVSNIWIRSEFLCLQHPKWAMIGSSWYITKVTGGYSFEVGNPQWQPVAFLGGFDFLAAGVQPELSAFKVASWRSIPSYPIHLILILSWINYIFPEDPCMVYLPRFGWFLW